MKFSKITFIGLFIVLLVSTAGYAQTCNDRIKATTPDSRFEVSGDEVKDLQTGLIWQRCSAGQSWDGSDCSGSVTSYTWADALSLSTGYWRIPNLKELASIIETACYNPAINLTVFPNTPSGTYWSSSPQGSLKLHAWIIRFYDGGGIWNSKNNDYLKARLVRDGQ